LWEKIVSGAKSAAATYVKEVAEEVVQDQFIAAGVMASLKAQGHNYSTDEVLKKLWETAKETGKGVAAPMAFTTLAGGGGKAVNGGYNHIVEEGGWAAQNAEYIQAAINGKTVFDTETGEAFTPKPGTGRGKTREQLRGWLRKHSNVEVVEAEEDDFNPTVEDIGEEPGIDYVDEDGNPVDPNTPWEEEEASPETQESTSPSASGVEAGGSVHPSERTHA
jgi:hypothetical protein